MDIKAQIDIARPRDEIFDYLSDAEFLPEYAGDFESVQRIRGDGPGSEAEYAYTMKRGVEGTFRHTVYQPSSRLVWRGPAAKAGLGTMTPAGSWELHDIEGGTRVTLTMSPVPGGFLRMMAPLIAASIRKSLPAALQRLKRRLEVPSSAGDHQLRAAP